MARILYTAEGEVSGGRAAGHGRTSDGALDVALRAPVGLGGEGGGTNPEQLFAVGFGACFESALATVARRRRIELGPVSVRSRVSLLREARDFALAVELAVTLPGVADQALAMELVRMAHDVCPYSRATRGNIPVELTVGGAPVA
jgi:osmotically inducible protein OsmC